jgi:hypothetical protein
MEDPSKIEIIAAAENCGIQSGDGRSKGAWRVVLRTPRRR